MSDDSGPRPFLKLDVRMLAFPVMLLVGLYVLVNDSGSSMLVEAGLVLLVVGAVGAVALLFLTGLVQSLLGGRAE